MIKKVDTIPGQGGEHTTQKLMINKDIRSAIEKRIERFEFVGDYNIKYLDQYAREEAERVFTSMFSKCRTEVQQKLREEFKVAWPLVPTIYDYRKRLYRVCRRSGKVYMEIYYDFMDAIPRVMLDEGRALTKLREENRSKRRRENEQRSENSNPGEALQHNG